MACEGRCQGRPQPSSRSPTPPSNLACDAALSPAGLTSSHTDSHALLALPPPVNCCGLWVVLLCDIWHTVSRMHVTMAAKNKKTYFRISLALPHSGERGLGELEVRKCPLNNPSLFSARSTLVRIFPNQSFPRRNQKLINTRGLPG